MSLNIKQGTKGLCRICLTKIVFKGSCWEHNEDQKGQHPAYPLPDPMMGREMPTEDITYGPDKIMECPMVSGKFIEDLFVNDGHWSWGTGINAGLREEHSISYTHDNLKNETWILPEIFSYLIRRAERYSAEEALRKVRQALGIDR